MTAKEKLQEELIENLTIQLITPEPTTAEAEYKRVELVCSEEDLRTELAQLKEQGSKESKCNSTCKWFKIGYGNCEWCIRNSDKNRNAHDCKDNYKSVTQSEQPVEAEEMDVIDIAKWLNKKGYRRGMDIYLGEVAGLIKSFMQEYDTHSAKVTLLSDDEIRKHLLGIYKPIFNKGIDLNRHFRNCAFKEMKWLREQIKSQIKDKQ